MAGMALWLGFGLVTVQAGSVIFVHPDGAGIAHWQAARMLWAGPDGELNWDKLPHLAVYRGHMADCLTASSNGGATTHAYGVKVPVDGFGSDGKMARRPVAASGSRESLMHEAMRRGCKVALVNSGSIVEPGTACFVASVVSREEDEAIARGVVESGADIILSGGEEWLLPQGAKGRHVDSGKRTDGLNLVEAARAKGYAIVYDRNELAAVPAGTVKLLGIFAAAHTFHDQSEEDLAAKNLPRYQPAAPTLAEMTTKALELLGGSRFLMVIEEEGSDNFGNKNNARGVLDALKRADDALGVASGHVAKHPDTLLLTAADSEAGDMDVIGLKPGPQALAEFVNGPDRNGAPCDLDDGGKPFLSAPDKAGVRHPFVITWGALVDTSGGIVVRAAGNGADQVKGSMDNTGIYQVMRRVLFP